MNHIHVINQAIQESALYTSLYTFIDYGMTFDSVEVAAVIEAMHSQGLQEGYVNILANIYRDPTADWVLPQEGGKLPIKKGVRQGETISPMLFTACVEVFKPLDSEGLGVRFGGEYLSNVLFADDIVGFSNSGEGLQQIIADLNRETIAVE